ncbi:hypothetical protein EN828_17730 [Mesorhizobium sp. M2D.F.Ca.ET.185.01.1.1]|uniref:hypothetical protein n=1 Tax=unclassified Mesorhizobium TaxID=325217 RepID=UPI000FD2FF95|nr:MULTISPECIES: hypothetical protein [unclassified Mesorhizobium]TGP79280.1 hypothetical protein EN870_14055 [bacterium M00.F.Ca.ET.227.01.1.1]TGQ00983.1 hypothetical protein EN864_03185 [bacterium M00.F.Ca.ET.221.01.1.1]TGQ02498.1 hypothetical protein EN865_00720 [bacterium M00.F.Ca.ET.222.01.1.1]TGS95991.1 hypothetical protein EN821_14785 [Mesorhizobium sp. M2D.F.Ca.ET.178.01.1.1]TGU12396.1 hypothetical protein EN806_18490 [bacterium M00.F.Ca.ET.163.01.1.1]TGU34364.1 hypothetical protein E
MSALSRRTLLRSLPMGLAAAALPAVTETPRADPIEALAEAYRASRAATMQRCQLEGKAARQG